MRELNVLSVGLLPKYQSGRPAVANPEVAAMRCKLLRGLNAQTVHFKGMPCWFDACSVAVDADWVVVVD